MLRDKSIDHQLHLEELREMENIVPMTLSERDHIRKWVRQGHSIDDNPWDLYDSAGIPMNYLRAHRVIFGFSLGPWTSWDGNEEAFPF